MKTVMVKLGDRSYPIHIGEHLIGRRDLMAGHIKGQKVMVVTDTTIAPLYLGTVMNALRAFTAESILLPVGEEHKNLDVMNRIITALLEYQFGRTSTLVALGGGVIGDMTGFAAACYQRGIDYIQIPTTLLAQVDASVGGKTAVNHPLGKNMIGAFHQPLCVIADTRTLRTLSDREFCAGLSEIIKYGLIRDHSFFEWLEGNIHALLERNPDALAYAIERSCQHKANVVAADEREADVRALLNLGHTFAHAIETGLGYGTWLHGEAVAAGIYMAADLSSRLGWLDHAKVIRIEALINQAHLPVRAPHTITSARMLELMSVDKKVRDDSLRLVLLQDIGKGIVTSDFDMVELKETLSHCRAVPEVA
ncbi:MAG: 3-dehydroquinate synthase [Gammaproteobacteria bacterium]|nr:3-dehydroquinate synthase [Gammaproteobacteria bacterium]MCI0591298.1 3-dehydroquinate synthase [Gammaproteobacteria bacterium]